MDSYEYDETNESNLLFLQSIPTPILQKELERRLNSSPVLPQPIQTNFGTKWLEIETKKSKLKIDILGVYPGDEFELMKKYRDKFDLKFIPVRKQNIGIRNSVDYVIATRNRGHHNDDKIMIAIKRDRRRFIDLVHKNGSFFNLVDQALSDLVAKQS